MKKIFVTVAEFLENGGKLYSENGGMRKVFHEDGMHVRFGDKDLYRQVVEANTNDYYVQIECTPHYV